MARPDGQGIVSRPGADVDVADAALVGSSDILGSDVVCSRVRAGVEVLEYCTEVVKTAPGLRDSLSVELTVTWD